MTVVRKQRVRSTQGTPYEAQQAPRLPISASSTINIPGLDMSRALEDIYTQHNSVRPNNTRKAYEAKQAEWYQWCERQQAPEFDGGRR